MKVALKQCLPKPDRNKLHSKCTIFKEYSHEWLIGSHPLIPISSVSICLFKFAVSFLPFPSDFFWQVTPLLHTQMASPEPSRRQHSSSTSTPSQVIAAPIGLDTILQQKQQKTIHRGVNFNVMIVGKKRERKLMRKRSLPKTEKANGKRDHHRRERKLMGNEISRRNRMRQINVHQYALLGAFSRLKSSDQIRRGTKEDNGDH